jgi:hypothetical protein
MKISNNMAAEYLQKQPVSLHGAAGPEIMSEDGCFGIAWPVFQATGL